MGCELLLKWDQSGCLCHSTSMKNEKVYYFVEKIIMFTITLIK